MFCNVFYALVFWLASFFAPHHAKPHFGFGVGNPKLDHTAHEHGSPTPTGAGRPGWR